MKPSMTISRHMSIWAAAISVALCFAISAPQTYAQDLRLKTVVIDPGHGGKDPGCVSRDKKTYEKNLVLEISKLFGEKIKKAYGDSVAVYYTRSTDVFVPLAQRADFANRKNADLFISIHINAVKNNNSASGHSAHVLGASSDPNRDLMANQLDIVKRENSVILLEEDYQTKYQGFDPNDESSAIFMTLMQSAFYEQSIFFAYLCEEELGKGPLKVKKGVHQDPFYVLWRTSMPAVLMELGFISNDSDLAVLRSESGREKIAEGLFRAFKTYKKNYDESLKIE